MTMDFPAEVWALMNRGLDLPNAIPPVRFLYTAVLICIQDQIKFYRALSNFLSSGFIIYFNRLVSGFNFEVLCRQGPLMESWKHFQAVLQGHPAGFLTINEQV